MLYALDMAHLPVCTRFGRMMQKNHWNRQGITQKHANLLVFVVSGTAIFTVEGVAVPIKAGDVLLIPAETPYTADTEDMCDYYFFHFTGELRSVPQLSEYPVMEQDFSFDLPVVTSRQVIMMRKTVLDKAYARFYECVSSCVDMHAAASFTGRIALDMELGRALLVLSQIAEQKNNRPLYPLVLNQMLEYIRKNLTQPMTTSELCRYCDISASYGARLFKKHLNTTMTQYITDQKLSYACELMRNTGMNISQIAAYLGFCDVFYFSKRFNEKYGNSPTQMFSHN